MKRAGRTANMAAMSGNGELVFGPTLRRRIGDNLHAFARLDRHDPHLKRAAVALVLLPDRSGRAGLLLTRRAPRMSRHAGQWALPGGRVDPGESVLEGALRELREEVNLALPPASVLGRLDDYPTVSGYLIAPVVLWANGRHRPRANPAEVASVHHVSLSEFARPDSPQFERIPESERPVIRIGVGGHWIHAPTAAMLHQFAEVALHGRHTRVAGYGEPVWAMR